MQWVHRTIFPACKLPGNPMPGLWYFWQNGFVLPEMTAIADFIIILADQILPLANIHHICISHACITTFCKMLSWNTHGFCRRNTGCYLGFRQCIFSTDWYRLIGSPGSRLNIYIESAVVIFVEVNNAVAITHTRCTVCLCVIFHPTGFVRLVFLLRTLQIHLRMAIFHWSRIGKYWALTIRNTATMQEKYCWQILTCCTS